MIYVSADWHCNHRRILQYCNRPFSTIKEHDDAIISNINKRVKADDALYFLGDLLFERQNYPKALENLLERLECRNIYWCLGNHDPKEYDIGDMLAYIRPGLSKKIQSVFSYNEIYLNNKLFVMCHYAMAIWNKSHYGSYMIYGHSHSTAETNLDRLFPGRRSMDVGIDNAYKIFGEYRPFSINEVISLLDKKHGEAQGFKVSLDHHVERGNSYVKN